MMRTKVYEVGDKVEILNKGDGRTSWTPAIVKSVDQDSNIFGPGSYYVVTYLDLQKNGDCNKDFRTEYIASRYMRLAKQQPQGNDHSHVQLQADMSVASYGDAASSLETQHPSAQVCVCTEQVHDEKDIEPVIHEVYNDPLSPQFNEEPHATNVVQDTNEEVGDKVEVGNQLEGNRRNGARMVCRKIAGNKTGGPKIPHGSQSSLYDGFEISGSQLDQAMAPTNNFQVENANVPEAIADASLPFIKSSDFWSLIEQKDVFKEFPQQPHFRPLQELVLEKREGTAFGLMMTFESIVKNIRKSSITDSEQSFEDMNIILADLKAHGFDVQSQQNCVNRLLKVRSDYIKHLEEESAVQAQKLRTSNSISQKDFLLNKIDDTMADLEMQLLQLRQKGQLIEKNREDDQELLSRLDVVQDNVKMAVELDKQQFDNILREMQQKRRC